MIRFALLASALVCCGCATGPDQSTPAGTEAATTSTAPRDYRTGSRLPSIDGSGSSNVGGMSKDEYMDDRNRGVSPTRSQ